MIGKAGASMYVLKEIAVITLIAALAMQYVPQHFWWVAGLILVSYAGLAFLSAQAFHKAYDGGLVRESRPVAGTRKIFFIAPGCAHRWLVKRHIWVYH